MSTNLSIEIASHNKRSQHKAFDRVGSNTLIVYTTWKFTNHNWLRALCAFTMIFVLRTFTCRPFASKLVLQKQNFPNNLSSVSAVMTRSSTMTTMIIYNVDFVHLQ